MVTLLLNGKGELYTCSQVEDYVFRGPEMAHCSLLAFAIDTWEEVYTYDSEKVDEDPSAPKQGWPAHV